MECLTPFYVRMKMGKSDHENLDVPVPCGKCPNCYMRRVSQWSFRLIQEEKISQSAYFITLTYDTRYVNITSSGYMSLDKRDVQLFFKRLRKDILNRYRKIRYFVVGEYGKKTFRPHYHAILFNADVDSISRCWNNGSVHFGRVEGASIGYTLKYMSKTSRIPVHAKDDRVREFGLMSKGLGESYLSPAIKKWHYADVNNRMYVNVDGNKKVAMPRYYKNKLYDKETQKRVGIETRRKMLDRKSKTVQTETEKAQGVAAAFIRVGLNKIDKL